MPKKLQDLVDEPLPKIPFVITPMLPKQGKMLVFAPYEHFKSVFLMDLLYQGAEKSQEDHRLYGQWEYVPFTSLFVEQELGDFGVKSRYTTMHRYRESAVAGQNIQVVTKRREIHFDDEKGMNMLIAEIESFGDKPPDVLCFDPIRKFYRGKDGDENDSSAVTKVIQSMDWLQEKYKCAIIFSHHEGAPNELNTKHRPRGSSVWEDEPDSIIQLEKPISSNHEFIRVKYKKIRHGERPKPPHFDLLFNKDTFTLDVVKKGEK